MRIWPIPALALALAAPAAGLRAEDFTIASMTRYGQKQRTQTVLLTPAKMKTTGDGSDSIVEFATGKMTFLDDGKKTYYVTSIEELTAYAKHREEQAKTSGFTAQSFGSVGPVEARRVGRSRQIAGFSCDEWVFSMGDALVFEVCAARRLTIPRAYYDARRASYASMGPMGRHFEKMFEAMRRIRGYPLSLAMHVKMQEMKQETLTEVTEVKKGGFPATVFEIPADYTKKKSPFAP